MKRRKLAQRERILVLMAIAVFAAIVLLSPARHFAQDYERAQQQAEDAADRLSRARLLRDLILEDRSGQQVISEKIQARDVDFNLYTFTNRNLRPMLEQGLVTLESGASRYAGSDLDMVQIRFRGVNMKQLVDLFHVLESSGNLIVMQRLGYLRPARNGKGLDCDVSFVAPKA